MTNSPLTTDQTILKILVGTDRDPPVMISKPGVLSPIRSMAPVDAVG